MAAAVAPECRGWRRWGLLRSVPLVRLDHGGVLGAVVNPVFIIILAGVFAALWTKLGERQPSTPIKFALGTMIMGVAFLLFLPFAGGGPNSTPLIGLIGILFVFTIVELLISPMGLSLSTKLAPEAFHTQMVALFFLSIALGTAMSGVLAGYYNPDSETAYFGILGAVAIGIGVVLLLLTPVIKKHERDPLTPAM